MLNLTNILSFIESTLFIDVLLRIAYVVVTITIGYVIAKNVYVRVDKYLRERGYPISTAIATAKIAYISIIIVSIFIAVGIAGIGVQGLALAGTVTGLVLGLALQPTLSNFFAGLLLFTERPVKIGDLIEIEGFKGYVIDIGILSTKIRKITGEIVRIPNEKFFTGNIVNYSRAAARAIELDVGIAYGSNISKAIDVIKRILMEYPYVLAEPEPVIWVEQLGNSSIVIKIRAWTLPNISLWIKTKSELLRIIKEKLDAEGIEIPFPQHVIWFRTPLKLSTESIAEES